MSLTDERRATAATSELSARMGVTLLAMLVFINESVFRRTEDIPQESDWQSLLKLAVCGACGLYGLFHFRKAASTLSTGAGFLILIFGIWATITEAFALDAVYGLGSCVALWCTIFFAGAIINELQPRTIVVTVATSLLCYVAASWAVYYLVPSLGREEQMLSDGEIVARFGGLNHPNGLGRQCALTIAMLIVAGIQRYVRWRVLAIPLLFTAITLLRTDSRTALLAAIAIVGVAIMRTMRREAFGALFFVVLPMIAVVLAGIVLTGAVEVHIEDLLTGVSRTGDSDEIYSLTGRTLVWEFALKHFFQSPLFGCGYGCSRFVMENNFFPTHHAHNLFLNTLLSTGVMGGMLLLIQMFAVGAKSLATRDPFPILLLTAVFVGGMADYMMLGPVPDSHTLLWLLALVWPVKRWEPLNHPHSTLSGGPA